MNSLLSLIPLIMMITIVPTIFASCCKLSAYLLRRRVVSWKQCFIFAFILVLISIIVNVIINLGSVVIPAALGIILALTIQVGLGSWFFSHRATCANPCANEKDIR